MVNEIPDGEQFRFLVEVAFTVTGRGTAVVGYVESGVTRVGDRLRVMRTGGRPALSDTCWAIEAVNKAGRKPGQTAPIALLMFGQ